MRPRFVAEQRTEKFRPGSVIPGCGVVVYSRMIRGRSEYEMTVVEETFAPQDQKFAVYFDGKPGFTGGTKLSFTKLSYAMDFCQF